MEGPAGGGAGAGAGGHRGWRAEGVGAEGEAAGTAAAEAAGGAWGEDEDEEDMVSASDGGASTAVFEADAGAEGGEAEAEEGGGSLASAAYDDWLPRPRAAVRQAEEEGPRLEVSHRLLWEVPEAPLGFEDLGGFGPNGPPMNVLDHCPVAGKLFVVNRQRLRGLPVLSLESLASGEHTRLDDCFEEAPLLRAQANRLRCGRVGGRPVVAVVDAEGHVAVLPTDEGALAGATTLRNRSAQDGGPCSTWGLALAPHREEKEGAPGAASAGEVVVSANDHCVKAWTLRVPASAPRLRRGGSPERATEDAEIVATSLSHSSSSGASGLRRAAGDEHAPTPRVLTEHSHNVPCVDLAGGRVLSASLDGSVRSVQVRTAAAAGVHPGDAEVRFRGQAHADRGMWGACWVPLWGVRTATPPGEWRSARAAEHLDWVVNDIVLPEEIISDSLLPFLTASELLRVVQLASAAHGRVAEAEVKASHRTEQLALCFSAGTVWLLGERLQVHCRRRLPFDATFAHISYAPDLSAAVLSSKLGPPASAVWVVTLVRRCRSLRFKLQIHPVRYESPEAGQWPAGVIVGMATAPGGCLFTLLASKRLACHSLAIKVLG